MVMLLGLNQNRKKEICYKVFFFGFQQTAYTVWFQLNEKDKTNAFCQKEYQTKELFCWFVKNGKFVRYYDSSFDYQSEWVHIKLLSMLNGNNL